MSAQTADAASAAGARRGLRFRYESYQTDPAADLLTCRYTVDGRPFEERITFPPVSSTGPARPTGPTRRWDRPAVAAAARLVFLLAGVSAYKTAAPPVIDTGQTALTRRERAFLHDFYAGGLGEFAYRNGIDLSGLRIEGPDARKRPGQPGAPSASPGRNRPQPGGRARLSRSAGELTPSSPSRWSATAPTWRCSWSPDPATGSMRSSARPPSPGSRWCAPTGRSIRSCCARVSWGSSTVTSR